jgi:hypothetical protein
VPSDASVRADHVVPYRATNRAADLLIETDSIPLIGPRALDVFKAVAVGHGESPFSVDG